MTAGELKKENCQHNTIIHYLEYDIIKENISFPILSLLTFFFIIQKLNDNLMAKWQAAFLPIYIYFVYNFIKFFIFIIKTESDEKEADKENKLMKMQNFSRITLISHFFTMINFALGFLSVYNLAEFLDKREDHFLFQSLYMCCSICISQILYSIFRKTQLFSIPIEIKENNNSSKYFNFFSFSSSLTAPILTYLSNMMIVCSSSSGVCTQIYMSTIASLLSAFGVTIADFSDYLFPITIILLGISLFSLFIKNKTFSHPPFLLGVLSAIMIIIAHMYDQTDLYYFVYPGNIMMISAAIWNARVNKFYGLPRFIK